MTRGNEDETRGDDRRGVLLLSVQALFYYSVRDLNGLRAGPSSDAVGDMGSCKIS